MQLKLSQIYIINLLQEKDLNSNKVRTRRY